MNPSLSDRIGVQSHKTNILMNNIVQVFDFNTNPVRTIVIDKQAWFVAKDICAVLLIKNVSDALSRLDDDEKMQLPYDVVVGLTDEADTTRLSAVSESGMYALILRSRKQEARIFRKWVTSEVLPSILRTGEYKSKKGQSHGTPVRLLGKGTRRKLTDAIQDYIDRHKDELSENAIRWLYPNVTNGLYLGTHKLKANQLVQIHDCKKAELRDHFSPDEIEAIMAIEFIAMRLIDLDDIKPIDAMRFAVEQARATNLFVPMYMEEALKLKAARD